MHSGERVTKIQTNAAHFFCGERPVLGQQLRQRRAADQFHPQTRAAFVYRRAINADDIGLAHAREPARFVEEVVRQGAGIDLAQFQRDLQIQQRIVGAPDIALRTTAERFEHGQGAETETVRGRSPWCDCTDLQMAKTLHQLLHLAQTVQGLIAACAFRPRHHFIIGDARCQPFEFVAAMGFWFHPLDLAHSS